MTETSPVTALTLKRVCTLQMAHGTDHLSYSLWNVPSLQERNSLGLATVLSNYEEGNSAASPLQLIPLDY